MRTKTANQNYFHKTLAIIFFLISWTNFSLSQFSVKILDEKFENNAMRWDIVNNAYSEKDILSGKYLLVGKSEGNAMTSTIDLPHLQDENFIISTSLSKLKGIDNNGYGLVWGGIDLNNEYEFVISGNGYFKITRWENGIKDELVGWTYNSIINKWDFGKNKLKIYHNGQLLRFYINDSYVAVLKNYKPFGQKTGFVLNEMMEIEIDEIVVENLTPDLKEPSQLTYTGISIENIEFKSIHQDNILYYGETAQFNIELKNSGTMTASDLSLNLSADNLNNSLLYNYLTMIENIRPNELMSIDIPISADDELANQNHSFSIRLNDINGNELASQIIKIETKGAGTYYQADENNNQYNQSDSDENNNPNQQYINTGQGCTKGCISTGVISVLTGIILTIL
jgi:hypothetical protein